MIKELQHLVDMRKDYVMLRSALNKSLRRGDYVALCNLATLAMAELRRVHEAIDRLTDAQFQSE